MGKLKYPWCYLHRHPILVFMVAWNYRQRKAGILPDEWFWADIRLMDKVFPTISNDMRKYADSKKAG